MWNCKKCNEEIEDTFDACWNCGTLKDGTEAIADLSEKKDYEIAQKMSSESKSVGGIESVKKKPVHDFKPNQYQTTVTFPNEEKIFVPCYKCEQEYIIFNPAFDRIDKKLKIIDATIFPQSGCAYKLAVLIASIPAIFIFRSVENPIAAIILVAIIGIPIYFGLRQSIIQMLGGMYNVGYLTCEECKRKIYIAFNPKGTKLMENINVPITSNAIYI